MKKHTYTATVTVSEEALNKRQFANAVERIDIFTDILAVLCERLGVEYNISFSLDNGEQQ